MTTAFWLASAAAFGAVFGSFLNVCIHRIPRRRSIVSPPSSCPLCAYPIPFYDNIPILSYVMLGGRCRTCRGSISIQYPIVEGLTALLFAFTAWAFWLKGDADYSPAIVPVLLAFVCALIVVSFVDFEIREIPDEISIGGMAAGPAAALVLGLFGVSLFGPELGKLDLPDRLLPLTALGYSLSGLLGGLAGLWLIRKISSEFFKKEAMGLGDVKLMGMMGGFLGPVSLFFILALGSLVGALVGITKFLFTRSRVIPFGPFLAFGGLAYLFFRGELVHFVMVVYPQWIVQLGKLL